MARLGVVIPAYNAAPWIDRSISSVRAQSSPPVALVVIDDGSTDGTIERARAAGGQITVLTGENRGACHARNLGTRAAVAAGATHLLFLDADDEIAGDYLEEAAVLGDDIDLLFAPVERLKDGKIVHRQELSPRDLDPKRLFERWLSGPQINPAGLVWRAAFLDRIGGWNEGVMINQDGEIVLRALLHRPRLGRMTRGRGIYHLGHSSLSSCHSEAKLSNYIDTLAKLLEAAEAAEFGPHTSGIEDTLYGVARMAFKSGWTNVGRRALKVLSAHGYNRHPGSFAHRTAARLIGLERKVSLWGS